MDTVQRWGRVGSESKSGKRMSGRVSQKWWCLSWVFKSEQKTLPCRNSYDQFWWIWSVSFTFLLPSVNHRCLLCSPSGLTPGFLLIYSIQNPTPSTYVAYIACIPPDHPQVLLLPETFPVTTGHQLSLPFEIILRCSVLSLINILLCAWVSEVIILSFWIDGYAFWKHKADFTNNFTNNSSSFSHSSTHHWPQHWAQCLQQRRGAINRPFWQGNYCLRHQLSQPLAVKHLERFSLPVADIFLWWRINGIFNKTQY